MTDDVRPPPGRRPAGPAAPGPAAPGEPGSLLLDQAFDADSLYALRSATAAHATRAGLPRGRADDLVIAVHELAANAVRHGAGHGRLRVWQTGQALLCEISDGGAPLPQDASQAGGAAEAGAAEASAAEASAAEASAREASAREASARDGRDAAGWRVEPGHGLSLVRQVADQTSMRSGPSGTLATISFALRQPGPPFRLDRRQLDHCTVLAVTGPLDLDSAGQLTDAIGALLGETPEPRLVVDLAGLAGWDSAGLAALITAQQRVSASPPGRMVLAALPAQLAKHLRETGLAERFSLAGSTTAAVATFT